MMTKLSVLFIDDSMDDVFFQSVALKRVVPDVKIDVCAYAQEALDYFSQNRDHDLDVIFLDIALPRMTGFDFLIQYSKILAWSRKRPRIVMVSASIDPKDIEKAHEHPMVYDFMRKPLTVDHFAAIVQRVIADRKAERMLQSRGLNAQV